MFDPFQTMMEKMISEYNRNLGIRIREAFQEHFGFPIEQVEDKENLQRLTVDGSPIESFIYRNETFLYYDHEMMIEQERDRVTIETRFMKV